MAAVPSAAVSKKKKRRKRGRPSKFTPRLAQSILDRLRAGETLTSICAAPTFPSVATVNRWQDADPSFRDAYMRARVAQMLTWADQIVDIADDDALDMVTKRTPQGREYEAFDQQNPQRARLRIDTRKFLMAKIAPAVFGDRLEVDHTGAVAVGHVDLTDRETIRRLALFLVEDDQNPPAVTVDQPPAGVAGPDG